jgi:hypothetical protein
MRSFTLWVSQTFYVYKKRVNAQAGFAVFLTCGLRTDFTQVVQKFYSLINLSVHNFSLCKTVFVHGFHRAYKQYNYLNKLLNTLTTAFVGKTNKLVLNGEY